MKTNFRRVAVTIGLSAIVGASLLMAGSGGRGTADIPFAFRVQDTELPQGAYLVEEMNGGSVLRILNEDTRASILVMAPTRKSGTPGDPKLLFNRYGDRYFLSQVWFAGDDLGHTLNMGHLEKEIARTGGTPGIVASIHIK